MTRLAIPRVLRVAVMAGLLTTLVGTTGCVSQEQYKQLETAFNQMRSQLAAADHQLGTLRGEIADLKAQIAEKDRLLSAQGGGAAALLKEVDALKARLARLQARYNKLLALAGSAPQLPAAVNDALARLAAEYPNLLEYNPKLGLLRFKSDLLFDLGSTVVRPAARSALKQFAAILDMRAIADNEIRIVGNTDNVPIRRNRASVMNPTNWYLSTNRAISVMYVLRHDGVLDRRMQVAGWGKTHPIAPNAPHHRGSQLNRRVDIFILPIKLKYNPYVPAADQPAGLGNPTNLAPVNPASTPAMTNGGTVPPAAGQ